MSAGPNGTGPTGPDSTGSAGTATGAGGRGAWAIWVGVATAVGLAVRIGTVLGRPHRPIGGDPFSYHYGANLLADGLGFINPWLYYGHNAHIQHASASYPPLFMMLLSVSSVIGFKSFFAHRIWSCIIGAAAIPLCAYVGREVAGRRAGVLAAFLVALYPNVWMNDELAMSETIAPVMAALVLLAAYRFWRRPRLLSAAALGAALGLAAMARDEMVLLTLLVVPLALGVRSLRLPRRAALVGAAAGAFVLLVGPWVGFNMARFQKPTFISTGLGVTLASANCATTYSGVNLGYWSLGCALKAPVDEYEDQSVASSQAQSYALRFIRAHEGELPKVLAAREGRAFALFRPYQQIQLDSLIETRPMHWAEVGLGSYYLLLVLSVPGILALRRRRVPVYPLLALGLDVAVSVAVTFGQTRYRSIFEVTLVVLGAVGIDALWDRLRPPPEPSAPVDRPAAPLDRAELGVPASV